MVNSEQHSINLLISLETIKGTIESYTSTKHSQLLQDFGLIKKSFLERQKEISEYQRLYAPEWNVFRVIGMERYEVAFHSPFLTELLKPRGSHGQGRLFLNSFLKQIGGLTTTEIESSGWYVVSETENIDLRISNDALQKAIFIENKIDTIAHSEQLSRYYELWRDQYSNGGAFVYLTIWGDPAPDRGFGQSPPYKYSRQEIEASLRRLSYKRNISDWLTSMLGMIEPQKLKQSIIQYIETIDNI